MPERFKVPPAKSEAHAAATARRLLEGGARHVAEGFTKPDDDWVPIWLVLTKTSGMFVSGDLHKHEMTEMVGALARKEGAIAVGHLHSSWMVLVEDLPPQRRATIQREMQLAGGSTEGIAERIEIVLLATYTASTAAMWTARIERHETMPPTLARFERAPGDSASGAMVDPLRTGLTRLG